MDLFHKEYCATWSVSAQNIVTITRVLFYLLNARIRPFKKKSRFLYMIQVGSQKYSRMFKYFYFHMYIVAKIS
jgi:hypothetical protein